MLKQSMKWEGDSLIFSWMFSVCLQGNDCLYSFGIETVPESGLDAMFPNGFP